MLAAIRHRTFRGLGLQVEYVHKPESPGHFEVDLERLTASQRKKKAQGLKRAAVLVAVEGSPEEVHGVLAARCAEELEAQDELTRRD